MTDLPVFDADNHYYEARDAFTRYLDPDLHKRAMQWAVVDGKERLLVGGRVNRFIPNPTFERVSKPGALSEYYRAKSGVADMRSAFGELEPIETRPEYRNRDARLALMDEQGLEGCIMLPTLGVGMETALEDDRAACTAAFSAFNRWLDEDWGFNYRDRIYAAPYISLIDVDWALSELERALERDARVILMRPGSVNSLGGRRTPGDPRHDAFWTLLDRAGVTLAVHGGDSGYADYEQIWGLSGEVEAFRQPVLKRLLSASPIHDMMASLMADRLFERFPNLRVATIETGSSWVAPLLQRLRKTAVQRPGAFEADPAELFSSHVWVSPFFEDDVLKLVDRVGAERVLFGSDFPHAEGLADPLSFTKELDGLCEADVRRIMYENARALVTPRPA
ncbi:MAG TPA: amidohydrolase family protein [Acidimicrobiales bacterium]|nr:amidohydrolase family protein [Acidimicrobiales bacterium]